MTSGGGASGTSAPVTELTACNALVDSVDAASDLNVRLEAKKGGSVLADEFRGTEEKFLAFPDFVSARNRFYPFGDSPRRNLTRLLLDLAADRDSARDLSTLDERF